MATPEEQRAYDDAREQKTVPKWLRDHGRECDELTKIYRAPTQGYLAAFDYQCSNGTIYKLGIVAGAEGQLVFRTDDDTKSSRPEVRTLPASSLGYVVEPNPIYPEDARRRAVTYGTASTAT